MHDDENVAGFTFWAINFFALFPCVGTVAAAPPNPPPDDRYKADILLIVAHPDDDSLAAPYLAKAIYEQHKHVSVIYGTRGTPVGTPLAMNRLHPSALCAKSKAAEL